MTAGLEELRKIHTLREKVERVGCHIGGDKFFQYWPRTTKRRMIRRAAQHVSYVFIASGLSGLPNANAKSQLFSNAISQIATLPLVVGLNRSSKSQIAARYAAIWHAISQIALASFL